MQFYGSHIFMFFMIFKGFNENRMTFGNWVKSLVSLLSVPYIYLPEMRFLGVRFSKVSKFPSSKRKKYGTILCFKLKLFLGHDFLDFCFFCHDFLLDIFMDSCDKYSYPLFSTPLWEGPVLPWLSTSVRRHKRRNLGV